MASILFCISEFSSIGSSEKGVCETKYGKEDGGQGGWKFDWGRWIPMNSVKSENYFENLDPRIGGMGHIESDKPNPAYMVSP